MSAYLHTNIAHPYITQKATVVETPEYKLIQSRPY